ncbi:MAG: hypothetical protein APR54_04500 [Candidatus Cloacimonas sp. SDB]|nr:MAG: hypothetical protein APR54_04500 [Candidatus Cloacimonas sp. SDB]
MNNQKKAYLLALLAVLFWSTAASAFKISLRYVHYSMLLLFSSLVSAFIFLFIILYKKEAGLLFKISRQQFVNSLLLGFLNPFLYYIVLFKAYTLIPAQQAQPLNFIWPVMLVILSIPILKQKISFRIILSLIISFLGVFIISTQGNFRDLTLSNPLGIFLALASSLIWALFWLLNMKDNRNEVHKLVLSFFFGSVFTVIYIFILGDFKWFPMTGLLGTIYVGFFEMGITFYIWLKALKLSRTTAEVNSLIYITPLLSLGFIKIIVGETITVFTILGVFLIIFGIIVNNRIKIPKKNSRIS